MYTIPSKISSSSFFPGDNLKRKRLNDSEIRAAVDKIRKRYTHYAAQYMKGTSALVAFEDRYIRAMHGRLDIAIFLHAELTAVEDLIKSKVARAAAAENRHAQHREKKEETKDFADRTIEEFRRLEEKILILCATPHGGIPTHVSRYKSLFEWSSFESPEIIKEERKVLLDAAFFLYDLIDVFVEMRKSGNLDPMEIESVEKMSRYVHTVVEDFRLKEFRSLRP